MSAYLTWIKENFPSRTVTLVPQFQERAKEIVIHKNDIRYTRGLNSYSNLLLFLLNPFKHRNLKNT
jgi:hypothetical protein